MTAGCTVAVGGQAAPGTDGNPKPAHVRDSGVIGSGSAGTATSTARGTGQAPPTPAPTTAADPSRALPQSPALAGLLMSVPAGAEPAEPWFASPHSPTVAEYGAMFGDSTDDRTEQQALLDRRVEGLAWLGWDAPDTTTSDLLLVRFPNPALAAGWARSVSSDLSQPPGMQVALPGLPDTQAVLTRVPTASGAAQLEVLTSCDAFAVRALFSFPLAAEIELATGWLRAQLSRLSGCSSEKSTAEKSTPDQPAQAAPQPPTQRTGGPGGKQPLPSSAALRPLLAVPTGRGWKPISVSGTEGAAGYFATPADGTPAELVAFTGYPADGGDDWLLRRLQALQPNGIVATAVTRASAGSTAECVTALAGFDSEDGAAVWYALREGTLFDDLGDETVAVPPGLAAGGSTVVYDAAATDEFDGETAALGQRGRFVAEISCVGDDEARRAAAVDVAGTQLPKLR
ncbi:hypothetical protein [Nakamurella aerolata]|uniref:Uncharacterized protein n=1 Tax=Nakamurella aerolata TaxID=1656892 RepID=A0A849A689_9ACTN|nr:hypothetical protein [Nakamurella aerolata]NNG36035.1 hypothetical protein [Nakamurella aerolata]